MKIKVEALKADGYCYRNWIGDLLLTTSEGCVVDTPPGTEIYLRKELGWIQKYPIRTFFLKEHHLNLMEVSTSAGDPLEIYINIASPMQMDFGLLSYIDYELDVVHDLREAKEPEIIDEDEFEEAKLKYGYSTELINTCIKASQSALSLTKNWIFQDDPNKALSRMHQFLLRR